MSDLQRLGRQAEDEAANFLFNAGYTIVTRRFNVKGGEIDLVALDGNVLVFVEVKGWKASGFTPEDGATPQKMQRMTVAAHRYLAEIGEPGRAYRFDFIAIDSQGLRHYKDALRDF